MSAGYFGDRTKTSLDDLYAGLIRANHILHHHRVLDAYGQISVRNPDNEEAFFRCHNSSPVLVSSREDVGEFKIEDASPVDPNVRVGFSERFIHSEIYKKFPGVNSVVHSHAADILPYTLTLDTLLSGTGVPVWDITSAYSSGDKQDLLVRSVPLAASLASAFTKSQTVAGAVAGSVVSSISSALKRSSLEEITEPYHPVVLMEAHGFTATGRGIEEVVYQAIYTQEAAKALTTAMTLMGANLEGKVEGKIDLEGNGQIKGGSLKPKGDLQYLTTKEAADTWSTNQHGMQRPWRSWLREVERNPLYEQR